MLEKYYIAVEYGIESCYNKTLQRINRGHTFEEAELAVRKTAALGINTGAHFIFGLPGRADADSDIYNIITSPYYSEVPR